MGKVTGGHIITVQHFLSAPSVSVMIPWTTVGKQSATLPAAGALLMWNLDPSGASHTLACAHFTLWCEVSNQDWSACLSLAHLSSSFFFSPPFPPSSGCCEDLTSHMSVLFWLCGSWLCWAPFCLPLWSPPRGLRTQRAKRQRRRATTAGSPCRRSTYPISSTTTRRLPSSAARTHTALLK